jgi:hypothetical protein
LWKSFSFLGSVWGGLTCSRHWCTQCACAQLQVHVVSTAEVGGEKLALGRPKYSLWNKNNHLISRYQYLAITMGSSQPRPFSTAHVSEFDYATCCGNPLPLGFAIIGFDMLQFTIPACIQCFLEYCRHSYSNSYFLW